MSQIQTVINISLEIFSMILLYPNHTQISSGMKGRAVVNDNKVQLEYKNQASSPFPSLSSTFLHQQTSTKLNHTTNKTNLHHTLTT